MNQYQARVYEERLKRQHPDVQKLVRRFATSSRTSKPISIGRSIPTRKTAGCTTARPCSITRIC